MKTLKQTLIVISILLAIGIIFRGTFYRSLITYKSIGQRTNYPITNDELLHLIEETNKEENPGNLTEIIKSGLSITSKRFNFTFSENESDPNKLMKSKTANCVGYAAFFSATCNYLLQKQNLSKDWIAKPQIGQLYLFGVNIHKCFDSPFFKNHDFVTIENKRTGEIYAVDPSVNDYFCIDFVTFEAAPST